MVAAQPVLAPLLGGEMPPRGIRIVEVVLAPAVALADRSARREQEICAVFETLIAEHRLQNGAFETRPLDDGAADRLAR